jgi:alpha-L-arabinofuranosidase
VVVHATLSIDATNPARGAPLPRYGVFFEDYNHGGDGGLYAELVRNRSFEDGETPEAWTLHGDGATMALDQERPLNSRNPTSLRLAMAAGATIRLTNDGYWGMALRKGARYRFSCYARSADIASLHIGVQSADGIVHSVATLGGISEEWTQRECVFVSPIGDARAKLAVLADGPGTLWLDMVSLFPLDTWRDKPNGMRRDIAELIADLRPAFVRFPGGTNLEGSTRDNALRWKNSIGDIAERPGVMQFWGYRLTEGIGHHELLQWCEDLGADALFTINCGLMAQWKTSERVPLDELEPWVRDALDAIDYAKAAPDTPWGRLRAQAGHPAPFGLTYLEIGNEHAGPPYEERFARFYDAVKAHDPSIRVVATCHVNARTPDLVDEHYYGSARRLAELAHWFDRYPRQGPKIIVTEYAVTVGGGMGTWEAALAEAVFLAGLERNGDVVELACYGGLFGNLDDPARTWDPNAIYFTTDASYGTPSYHLQRLFAAQRGSHNLPVRLALAEPEQAQPERGRIGLGSIGTQVEFRDLQVRFNDELLLDAPAGVAAAGWERWCDPRLALRNPNAVYGAADDLRYAAGDLGWEDCTISFMARKHGGAEGFRVFFYLRDPLNWHCWRLGAWRNTRHVIERCANGVTDTLGVEASGAIEEGRWYAVRVELRGAWIHCFLDDRLVVAYQRMPDVTLAASASYARDTSDVVIKLVNRAAEAREVLVALDGVQLVPGGTEIVMTADPTWEHSLAQQERVTPVVRTLGEATPHFQYSLAPYTVVVLRLPTTEKSPA